MMVCSTCYGINHHDFCYLLSATSAIVLLGIDNKPLIMQCAIHFYSLSIFMLLGFFFVNFIFSMHD